MNIRIVFMGSPDFAVPTLQAIANHYPVVGVVTQPDRPAGRGRKLLAPPVKVLAQGLGIPIVQPEKLRTDTAVKDQLRAWAPTVIIVAAFGQILKTDVLTMAPLGCINVHASLLPRWRGVSPIQAALIHGDAETGVTIMKMDEGIDTGAILEKRAIAIEPEETGGTLFDKLAHLGAELLIETLPDYLTGKISPQPQGDSPTPYVTMIQKSDGKLDFTEPADTLVRKIRAYSPWPGAFTQFAGKPLKIHAAYAVSKNALPGAFTNYRGLPAIGTTQGILVITNLQLAGKKPMPGETFLRGARDWG
jgi:methionyl-tRNA formyltransferase